MEYTILSNLNDEQKLPASIIDGAILVTAGAGSGKTRMLTHRIAHMVKEKGINPNHIMAITFTNKAANEMKERLEKMIDDIEDMWICTFHAMCSRILRRHADLLGYTKSFSIYGDSEKESVIKKLMKARNIDPEDKNSLNHKTFAWHISNAKNNIMSPEEYSKYIGDPKKRDLITGVFQEYEETLFKANALDFDDLLVKTYVLLKKFPDTLEYYQNRFEYIFVDEFQDTNTSQYELVKLLANKYKNIFAVGDEDQCIYSWRGAQVGNVKQFTIDFAPCQVFKLEQNYRSTKKIIELANKIIKNNTKRIDKNLWTANDEGKDVELKQTYNDFEEAEFVAEKIIQLVKNEDLDYKDFSVLMRTNSLSRKVEEKLLTYNIPYKIYGGFKFFERKEVKDTAAYLYIIANPNDTEAVARMLAFPKKGIGDVSIAQIISTAKDNDVSLMDVINNASGYGLSGALANKLSAVRDMFDDFNKQKEAMPLDEFAEYVVKKAGIKEAIGMDTEENETKCNNVDEFLNSVKNFAELNEGAGIDEFLQSITLMRDIDSLNEEDNYVTLMTVHAAKGLEFNNVFIIGLNDGLFPLSRAINSNDTNELEEERRLMYVAITRAKKRLFLSRPKMKLNYESGRTEYAVESRFLTELFGKINQTNQNSAATRSNLYDTGFGSYLSQREKADKLSQNMSSHINVVNVSGSSANTQSSANKIDPSAYSKFKTGVKVKHAHFGEGVVTLGVTDFASAFVTIKFDTVGIKTLSLKYANLEIID